MKKICYVLSTFPVLSETFIGNEIRAMQALGHEITPIILRKGKDKVQPEDLSILDSAVQLEKITPQTAISGLWQNPERLIEATDLLLAQNNIPRLSLAWTAAKVAAIAKARGCQHIHAHFAQASAATSIVAARLAGIPVSFTAHGYDVYAAPFDLPLKLQNSDFVVAVCNDMAEYFNEMAPSANVVTIHCGVDTNRFQPIPFKKEEGPLRLLFVGRLVDSKGLSDLLIALSKLNVKRDWLLNVVGDGPEKNNLIRLSQELGIEKRVNFTGAVTSSWIVDNGPHHDVLVAPFKIGKNGTRDTGPVVVKEGMAMGLPVIASNFMGIKEIVSPHCGMLFPPGNVDALACLLKKALEMPRNNLRQMGHIARERICQIFSLQGQAESLSRVIERS